MAAITSRPEAALSEATRHARRAVELVPARAGNHEELARVLAARAANGDRDSAAAAQRAIDQVVRLAPVNALLQLQVAQLELVLERPERARAIAQRVAALYPDHAPALVTLAEAALALGDSASAEASLRRAFTAQWHGDSVAMRVAERLRPTLP
jgi:predicted Zn-dependent protease